jgi:hypothetical protein
MKRFLAILLLSLFAVVAKAGTEVYAPTLKSPVDASTNQLPNVTLSWNAVVGSVNLMYEIQIDTTTNFNSSNLTDTTLVLLCGYTCHELHFGAKYYWRVRAIDLGVTSDWSSVRTLTVFSQVTLATPKTGGDTLSPSQNLTWVSTVTQGPPPPVSKTISGVKSFEIQLDSLQSFNSPGKIDGIVEGTKYTFAVSNLRFGTKYYWRVRPVNNLSSGQWSTVNNFTVAKALVPTAPLPNATDQMLDALLKWKSLKGILGYEYQLALDAGFTNVVASSEVTVNSVNSNFTMFGTKYYWRVRARHISDTTNWSPVNAFTTTDKVKLSIPSNNSTGVSIKPTMKWTEQSGIVKYQLQLDIDQNFPAPLLDLKFGDTVSSYVVTKSLKNNTLYYWRMRAFSDSEMPDTSSWGEVWNFTTLVTGIGENDALTSSIYPNPASGKVNIRLDVEKPVLLQATVIDLLGSTLIREEFELTSGINVHEINISNLSKGVYIVKLTYDGNVVNHKLIVDR